MKRVNPPTLPVILFLCLGLCALTTCTNPPGKPVHTDLVDTAPQDGGGDAEVRAPDTEVVDVATNDLPDVADADSDAPDPCVCVQGVNCGQRPDCEESCGLCGPGDYCLDYLCVSEGSVGTPCEEDDDCVGDAPCLATDPAVCSMICVEDEDCPEDWACLLQPGDVMLCVPPCEDAPECGTSGCGFLEDGCGTYVPCGGCEEENQICGADNLCICEFEACGELCCNPGEACEDGACVLLCDPPCETCFVCDGGQCFPKDCPVGEHCENDICVQGGVACDPCDGTSDCAPGLTCPDGFCRDTTDATCDGCDDDGDGDLNEDYVPDDTCGEGICQENNTPSVCVSGVETPCQPGDPLGAQDLTCDGVDDDCDGAVDDDFLPDATCGVGACQSGNTPSTCVNGVETPCEAGSPLGDTDAICDGVDDDCDGAADEDYVSDATCGVGWCLTNNTPSSCAEGVETPCEPGPPASADTTCNGVDDDCDGDPDDDYIPDATCGKGVCKLANTPSSCVDGFEKPCQPGEPIGDTDAVCDGLDDDCDGTADEDYVSDSSCGVGYCQLENTPSACVGSQETPCVPAAPLGEVDDQCDYIDDDCDGETDEDADPPCATGAPVTGADVTFLTSLGLSSGVVSDNDDGTYSSAVVDLTNPNQTGALSASCNDNTSDPIGFSVVAGEVAEVALALSRTQVCADAASTRACARVTDDMGAPAAAGVSVLFSLEIDGQTISQAGGAMGDGLFCAWLTVPGETFQDGAEGLVTAAADGVLSDSLPLEAMEIPGALTLEVGEAGIRLPLCERLAGTTFEVPVTVNTGNSELGSYNITCAFDGNVLEVQGVSKGDADAMGDPVPSIKTGSVSFTAINTAVDGTAKGPAVEIAVLSFAVKDTAGFGDTAAMNCEVKDLYNTNLVSILSDPTVQIHDGDGQGDNGFVDAASLTAAGVFAVLVDNGLMDFARINGEAAVTLVKVMGLMNDGGLEDLAAAPGTVCVAQDPNVAVSAGCAVTATGAGTTVVTATAGGFESETALWVLEPVLPAQVSLSDSNLRYIPNIDRLQEARMRVVATFTDGDLFEFEVDVTEHAGFASTMATVAKVDGQGVVVGVGNGTAAIVATGAMGDELGSASVDVQGMADVSVTDIHVVVPATVQVTGLDPMSVPGDLGETEVEATVTNLFNTDGQQVQATVQLVLSDDAETGGGSRIDVTGWKDSDSGGVTGFSSSDGGVISVDDDGMVTAVGSGDAQVVAAFENDQTGYSSSGNGAVEVNLPPPMSVDLTVDDPRLALSDGDTAHTNLGLPVARQLGVVVHFVNGTSKDFTALAQTHYAVTGNLATVTNFSDCSGVPGCAPGLVSATGQGPGTAMVTVTFPGTYLDAVTATLQIEVVSHDEILLKSVELYTPQDEDPVLDQVLSWIECTTSRQQSSLLVEEIFTDGSVVELSGHPGTTYGVYAVGTDIPDNSVITANENTDRLTAVGIGMAEVRAMNSGHSSGPLLVQVDNEHLDVVELDLSYPLGATFHGVRDSGTGQLSVVGTFADGTRVLLTGADEIDNLLTFSSDAPSLALVDASGLMSAKGNGPVNMLVDLGDATDCGDNYQMAPGLALKVNLLPSAGDVDMGFVNGLAFPDQAADAVFEIPVRVNTGGATLGGIDLEITYDPMVITPLDAVVGAALPGAIFNANLATPGTIYLNASPALGSPVSGGGVEVAVLTFQALKADGPQVTAIGGTVVGVVDTDGAKIGEETPRPIVAGAGLFDPPPGGVWGDANDDESFTIADVLFVQQIIVEPPLVVPSPTQVAQSDLFPDGVVASNDAFYASRNLARLVHFVDVAVTATGFPGQSDIKVTITDRDQEPVDQDLIVRIELETIANLDTILFTDLHEFTESGVVTQLVGIGNGQFVTTVSGIMADEPGGEPIGVVVILDLLGPDDEIIETTAFIQTPLIDPAATFVPISYVDEFCEPDCDGAACGEDDGCNGICAGTCPFGNQICINGSCVCGGVSCAGKACGEDDGCGSPCDVSCSDPDAVCTEGGCECPGALCEGDCCPEDEVCAEYPPGSGNMICTDECIPDCDGKACGAPDGCDWFCDGTCPELNQVCSDAFICGCAGEYCVDHCCPVNNVCLDDACCEILTCDGEGWECGAHFMGCSTFKDCGSCGLYGICDDSFLCDCEFEKCGGTCCDPGETCQAGVCTDVPVADCEGKLCGDDDGAGGVCEGPCVLSNQICVDPGEGAWFCGCVFEECNGVCCDQGLECHWSTGDCAPPCVPDCDGKLCGHSDGCGGICHGPCPLTFQYCTNGKCLCEGNAGFTCGGLCCQFGYNCDEADECDPVYEPDCVGKPCGADDGHGGICLTGSCAEDNQACNQGTCVCAYEFCGGLCCDEGDVCDGNTCCTPFTCEELGAEECGEVWDGCGEVLDCGTCGDLEYCTDDYTCECLFHEMPCGDVCCDEYQDCVGGECIVVCVPSCAGKACGDTDGCGGECDGPCPGSAEACTVLSVDPVVDRECVCLGTSCLGKDCGAGDGCGGICDGPCPGDHQVCSSGGCQCAGNDGATCGPDQICCPADWICNDNGECEFDCPKDCDGKACGEPDGCNGLCDGPCPGVNEICNDTYICECAGDFCIDGCCPLNHVCYLDECCEVDTCEGMGYECGSHYIGCGTFTACGDCGDFAICGGDFTCECENVACGDTCCEPGLVCKDIQGVPTCAPYCNPSCLNKACGELDTCGENECYGDCPLSESCSQVAPGDFECGCAYVECEGVCCPLGEYCLEGLCGDCDPVENCAGKFCGDDDGCGGLCYGECPGLNEYCDPGTGQCLCANGDLPCDGECCPWGMACEGGQCILDCTADCDGKLCGEPDDCDGFCDGPCPGDRICVNNAVCVCPFETCGGVCCSEGDLCDDGACCQKVTCAAYGDIQCGLVDDGCGNILDCGSCGQGEFCNAQLECECEFSTCGDTCCGQGQTCLGGMCCIPQCNGKACGEPDLCGFLCDGPCPGGGEVCVDGECLCGGANCVGKECGADDGCGGLCTSGACGGENEICSNGVCLCANGDPECDGICCPENFFCLDDQCTDCFPFCEGKVCGADNGCGGPCDGSCVGENMVCNDQYFCDCAGDWCNDECCPDHNICVDGACCELDSCDTVPPFGAQCGFHDLGCGTLSSCGDCADLGENMFCDSETWTCQCEFGACDGECCPQGTTCWEGHGCVDCIPDCESAECGASDGCGGVCDEGSCADPLALCEENTCQCPDVVCDGICCPEGYSCVDDACEYVCIPICVGKLCGEDDGCGHACPGDCLGDEEICVAGACICKFEPCGDTCCVDGEICDDGTCTPCTPSTCEEVGGICGFLDNGCGGTMFCGTCGPNEICLEGACFCEHLSCLGFCCGPDEICDGIQCTDCPSDCTGKACGEDDGCGNLCGGDCPGDNQVCLEGACECEFTECLDACCASDEWCIAEECVFCEPDCGGKVCGAANGCGAPCDGPCASENEVCVAGECQCGGVLCDGACCAAGEYCLDGECACEFDSCGGECCIAGDTCLGGACCTPECENKLCGADNGCAGPCIGPCVGDNLTCDKGACVCEFEACGGQCCAAGEICEAGACVPCVPNCGGKNCGAPDGCGNACDGPCPLGWQACDTDVGACYCAFSTCGTACCAQDEACIDGDCVFCEADCDGKDCGADSGCGYPCTGPCSGAFEVCNFGLCQCSDVDCFGTCCGEGEDCVNGGCCERQCDGKSCGAPDGCGGACQGPCAGQFSVCVEGQCLCEHLECFGECCDEGSTCGNDTCCLPKTCVEMEAECGFPSDGCGNVQYCGACGENHFCTDINTCVCLFDTCNGVCCLEGESCVAGECQVVCIPDCSQAVCGGDDGCGGTCLQGYCSDGWSECFNGICECLTLECGEICCGPDQACLGGECCQPLTCTEAGAFCGLVDDGCGGHLDCGDCQQNGWCDGLHQCHCVYESCAGTCCNEGGVCVNDQCCDPSTCEELGATCGGPDGGCGEPLECGECEPNEACGPDFQCGCPGAICNDICCGAGVSLCDAGTGGCGGYIPDCDGKNCGDDDGFGGLCNGPCDGANEACEYGVCECEFDACGDLCCPETDICVGGECVLCVPDCDEQGCGADDGCGGLCDGPCGGSWETCVAGVCECVNVSCEDGCCAPNEACDSGVCTEVCIPACEDMVCGAPDGCGGGCNPGYCPLANQVCLNGTCECAGVTCGPECCAGNEACIEGECVCLPSCLSKLCGETDGCESLCEGECAGDNQVCVDFGCQCEFEACGDLCCAVGEGCVDGQCECIPDCSQALCGSPDGCGGVCAGPCPYVNSICVDYECQCVGDVSCDGVCCEVGQTCFDDECCDPATCEEFPDVECGVIEDVCGGPLFCGSCPLNQWCTEESVCECLYDECDGICCGENQPCLEGECCQPLTCEDQGWECSVIPNDCNGWVDCGECQDNASCTQDYQCECLWDECGDACCLEDEDCFQGECVPCIPDCEGKICGEDNGCEGTCDGLCDGNFSICVEGACECLFETCGNSCCSEAQDCLGGQCFCPAGEEGCGADCCSVGEICGPGNVCICNPACPPDAVCGDPDGCGGQCNGSCTDPTAACLWQLDLGCTCSYATCGDHCCGMEESCDPQTETCVPCVPSCDGKACGDPSGCGYGCSGPCADENQGCLFGVCSCNYEACGDLCCGKYDQCQNGECVTLCEDLCDGAVCGASDGCGGFCETGTCAGPGEICVAGECICVPSCGPDSNCGDDNGCEGFCSAPCPGDFEICVESDTGLACQCGFAPCGDGCCADDEVCDDQTEQCTPCVADCVDKNCGDPSGCGYNCGGPCPGENETCELGECACEFSTCEGVCCGQNEECTDGVCTVPCVPQCYGATCGEDNGCGKPCFGFCPVPWEICIEGACSCEVNCDGAECGDFDGCGGICDGTCLGANESCNQGMCTCDYVKCNSICCDQGIPCTNGACCLPNCDGKACGEDDGCGSLCDGPCPDPTIEACVDAVCECLFVGCNGSCCGDGQVCSGGDCCTKSCVGASCGDPDGCGGVCDGSCPGANKVCESGSCVCEWETCAEQCCGAQELCEEGVCVCMPSCDGAMCGDDDGCNGLCDGTCTGDYMECDAGTCVCVPNCEVNLCGGDDGCGGTCIDEGLCPPNEYCEAGSCHCQTPLCGDECCSTMQECQNEHCVDECVSTCPPDAQCGDDDQCGGTCFGTCPGDNQVCLGGGQGCQCAFEVCGDACCGALEICNSVSGQCEACTADCVDVPCGGSNGCGGFCSGICEGGFAICVPEGGVGCQCVFTACGDACCGPDESCDQGTGQCVECVPDCDGKLCGEASGCGYPCNGLCEGQFTACEIGVCACAFSSCGENCCGPTEVCDVPSGECVVCVPDCEDKSCGADSGCGYPCINGPCDVEGMKCINGECQCLYSGCSQACCGADESCDVEAGQCVSCVPDCEGKACGEDSGCGYGCDGTCEGDNTICSGTLGCQCEFASCLALCCAEGEVCEDGVCQ